VRLALPAAARLGARVLVLGGVRGADGTPGVGICVLERRVGGGFLTVARAATGRSGACALPIRPARAGRGAYRLRFVPRRADLAAGVSPSATMLVRARARRSAG
jgi:hypothetical protein